MGNKKKVLTKYEEEEQYKVSNIDEIPVCVFEALHDGGCLNEEGQQQYISVMACKLEELSDEIDTLRNERTV